MINRIAFFNRLKTNQLFNEPLSQGRTEGMNAILDEWEASYHNDLRWLAYMLATTYHETAKTMQPIEEYGKGKGRKYGQKLRVTGKPYIIPDKLYYGRGFVQLTWIDNYEVFGKLLNIDLVNEPERALYLNVATKILFIGMSKGLFTGVGLGKYFNETTEDWTGARKIINGKDKADLIALYGKRFLACLT